jgi:hypothetical protein
MSPTSIHVGRGHCTKGEASQATGQEIVMRCQCKYGHVRYLTARASRSHVLRSLTVSLSFFTAALKDYSHRPSMKEYNYGICTD